MSQLGTVNNPLRVAIIGAGPTGFYAADYLLKQKDLVIEADLFDRLPTPFGLVRGGVAPDHQKIKTVTKAFDRTARRPHFRFFGYVEFGRDIYLEDLKQYYHQIIFSTGAQTDRNLGIPGEGLKGSHAATEFVAWYNSHPDYRHCKFDLSHERVVIIGVGNVAVDVARILCRRTETLAQTDIADYALEDLRHSQIKEVYMLGRRGPAQAAFTTPEIQELGRMKGTDVILPPEEARLDALSQRELSKRKNRRMMRKVEILQDFAQREIEGKPRKLIIRFLVSPVEIIGDEAGHVSAIRLVRNELYATESGALRPRATEQFEEIPVGLVFRSVGYRGVPLPGVPFYDKWGIILNDKGRVLENETRKQIPGLYTAGWIKRGPSGIIGTNKPDAVETVDRMLEDLKKGIYIDAPQSSSVAAEKFIRERQPNYFSYADWHELDRIEIEKGRAEGRPRVKFTNVEDMLAALRRQKQA